tara:strand:+ start:3597 stop:5249 length:1653 start_codon:yes stop_codon:yes gene_type:complete
MKLIRLTSNNNGEFESFFNEDIVIKENAKIGLKSASLSLNDSEIVIKGPNRKIDVSFQVSGSVISVSLDEATYNSQNDADLLTNIQSALNSAMGTGSGTTGAQFVNDKAIGVEWRVSKNTTTSKTEISYLVNKGQGALIPSATSWCVLAKDIQTNYEASVTAEEPMLIWTTNATPTDKGTNFFISKRRLAKGRGHFRTKIYKLGNLAAQGGDINKAGFSMGVTSKKPIDGDTEIRLGVGDIRVVVPAVGAKYTISMGGHIIKTDQTIVCEDPENVNGDNDVIEIQRVGRQLFVYIYPVTAGGNHQSARVQLFSTTLPAEHQDIDLYPFVTFLQGGGTVEDPDLGTESQVAIQATNWTISGYDLASSEHTDYIAEPRHAAMSMTLSGLGEAPQYYNGDANVSDNFLQFASLDLANFLGFRNRRVPTTGFLSYSGALASDAISPLYVSDFAFNHSNDRTFLVLLDSIALTSYDGMQNDGRGEGQKKSILSVLMNVDGSMNERVIFNTSSPDMIDISNKQPLTLRTIKIRVVDDEYNSIDTIGNDVLVLYIED